MGTVGFFMNLAAVMSLAVGILLLAHSVVDESAVAMVAGSGCVGLFGARALS